MDEFNYDGQKIRCEYCGNYYDEIFMYIYKGCCSEKCAKQMKEANPYYDELPGAEQISRIQKQIQYAEEKKAILIEKQREKNALLIKQQKEIAAKYQEKIDILTNFIDSKKQECKDFGKDYQEDDEFDEYNEEEDVERDEYRRKFIREYYRD